MSKKCSTVGLTNGRGKYEKVKKHPKSRRVPGLILWYRYDVFTHLEFHDDFVFDGCLECFTNEWYDWRQTIDWWLLSIRWPLLYGQSDRPTPDCYSPRAPLRQLQHHGRCQNNKLLWSLTNKPYRDFINCSLMWSRGDVFHNTCKV